MRQSRLFTRTRHDAPADEVSKNAQLLIRAGFVHKEMAGAYSFLPLGLKTLNKVIGVIREEMDGIGGQEETLTGLQDPAVWEATGRFDDEVVDVWFKTKLKNDTEIGLGFTHEEPITRMMREHLLSHKDAPKLVYQFQTKFRNETRAKSGIMRTREFIMKDLYSFSTNEEEHQDFYNKAAGAYRKIFNRVGIGYKTYITQASGGSFSEFSHEFQTLCEAGEDLIHITDESNKEAINKEVAEGEMKWERSVEEGNIFNLGTKFSDPYLKFKKEDGTEQNVFMGSYGIGPARLMGTIVEVLSDEKGIIWPKEVAPFEVHLISLNQNELAEEVYNKLQAQNIEVLYDDRDLRAGEKFADADLIGIPFSVVIGDSYKESGELEVRKRAEEFVESMS